MSTITRRMFIQLVNRGLAATGLVAVFTPIIAYFFPTKLEETPSEPLLVGKTEDIPLNESKTVKYGRYPALVINTDEGIKAYSAVCTHFACVVKWKAESGKIYCPCHDGYFDAKDGHVISGPPPTPLNSIKVNIVNDDIYIGGEA
jgi:cytochrome b6-f complex iron-sulfur subunit